MGAEAGGSRIISSIGHTRVPLGQRGTRNLQKKQLERVASLQKQNEPVIEELDEAEDQSQNPIEHSLLGSDVLGHRPSLSWNLNSFYLALTEGESYWDVVQVKDTARKGITKRTRETAQGIL